MLSQPRPSERCNRLREQPDQPIACQHAGDMRAFYWRYRQVSRGTRGWIVEALRGLLAGFFLLPTEIEQIADECRDDTTTLFASLFQRLAGQVDMLIIFADLL